MKIAVCIKQVPDPETPASAFKVDPSSNSVIPAPGVAPVVDPYAENAIEAALQIKDRDPETYVVAVCLGGDSAKDALKHAASMGCDESVHINDPVLARADSYLTARALAAAIARIEGVDLILCGRQAADDDMGVVPLGIAELLDLPATTIALSLEVSDRTARVHRLIEDGYDVIELPLPAVISISNEIGQARYPTLKGIMGAGKKPLTVYSAADLGLTADALQPRVRLDQLYVPSRESKVEYISGDTPAEAAVALALRLRQEKLI